MSRSRGATSLTIRSPIRIVPSVISSSPATMRRSVDFPEPDGPTTRTYGRSVWTTSLADAG